MSTGNKATAGNVGKRAGRVRQTVVMSCWEISRDYVTLENQ